MDANGNAIFALFQDSDADALAACNITPATSNYQQQASLKKRLVAGSTSARTFKIRWGSNGGYNTRLNRRDDNATIFGNIMYSHLKITEFAP
jgi:hypothetical protein